MTGTRKWNSGIAARGSIYVANEQGLCLPRAGRNAYAYSYTQLLRYFFRYTATLRLRLQRPLSTATSTLNCHGATRNCDGYANCDSDANCHSLRLREPDGNPQTNPNSETPHDTEATPDSAAKAGHCESIIRWRMRLACTFRRPPKTGATRQSDTERESPRSSAREGACGPPKRK